MLENGKEEGKENKSRIRSFFLNLEKRIIERKEELKFYTSRNLETKECGCVLRAICKQSSCLDLEEISSCEPGNWSNETSRSLKFNKNEDLA